MYCRKCRKVARATSKIITRKKAEKRAAEELDLEQLAEFRKMGL